MGKTTFLPATVEAQLNESVVQFGHAGTTTLAGGEGHRTCQANRLRLKNQFHESTVLRVSMIFALFSVIVESLGGKGFDDLGAAASSGPTMYNRDRGS